MELLNNKSYLRLNSLIISLLSLQRELSNHITTSGTQIIIVIIKISKIYNELSILLAKIINQFVKIKIKNNTNCTIISVPSIMMAFMPFWLTIVVMMFWWRFMHTWLCSCAHHITVELKFKFGCHYAPGWRWSLSRSCRYRLSSLWCIHFGSTVCTIVWLDWGRWWSW